MRRTFLRLSFVGLLAYLGLHAMLALFQRRLTYPATRASEAAMNAQATEVGLEPWLEASGGTIGWKRAARSKPVAANRLVVFHGNAGFAQHRIYYLEAFESLDAGRLWDVHLFEYPGYGARPGQPGESEFTQAALAAIDQLAAVDRRPIFVLGESIGSGPACAVARDRPQAVAGLFLVTPLCELAEVAAHHYPFLAVRFLLRDRWDNAGALRHYRGRLATLLAGEDEVIPAHFGRRLHEGFAGPKHLWTEKNAGHNTLDLHPTAPWWREVSEFLTATRPVSGE
jgi:pimeloyl-ACP methyl ester carboxylesterase